MPATGSKAFKAWSSLAEPVLDLQRERVFVKCRVTRDLASLGTSSCAQALFSIGVLYVGWLVLFMRRQQWRTRTRRQPAGGKRGVKETPRTRLNSILRGDTRALGAWNQGQAAAKDIGILDSEGRAEVRPELRAKGRRQGEKGGRPKPGNKL